MCDGKKGKFTLFKFILIKGSQEGLRHVTVVENMQYPAASAISREKVDSRSLPIFCLSAEETLSTVASLRLSSLSLRRRRVGADVFASRTGALRSFSLMPPAPPRLRRASPALLLALLLVLLEALALALLLGRLARAPLLLQLLDHLLEKHCPRCRSGRRGRRGWRGRRGRRDRRGRRSCHVRRRRRGSGAVVGLSSGGRGLLGGAAVAHSVRAARLEAVEGGLAVADGVGVARVELDRLGAAAKAEVARGGRVAAPASLRWPCRAPRWRRAADRR